MPRKPKATRATEASVLDTPPAPARRGRPPRAAKVMPQPTETEDSGAPNMAADATASEPVEIKTRSGRRNTEAKPAEPAAPSPAEDAAASSKPAARWDAAADTVQFDWPEIEQTASRPGPNQVMAKLLLAARAEGASSRWPFQAA